MMLLMDKSFLLCYQKRKETKNKKGITMLSTRIRSDIERDYAVTISDEQVLGSGSNGSVYRLQTSSDFLCVKSIAVSNASVDNDYKTTKAMCDSDTFTVRRYVDDSYHYIVMPFYKGEDLSKIIAKSPKLDLEMRKCIFKKLIQAVWKMHLDCGILHRDLKAENVIVDIEEPELTVYIIDFGRSVRIFDRESGRPLSTPALLSLKNTTNSWASLYFYPVYQWVRRWQPQTAPELTLNTSQDDCKIEADEVGNRSDHYAVINLFSQVLPELCDKFREHIEAVTKSFGQDRNSAYGEFIVAFEQEEGVGKILSSGSWIRPQSTGSALRASSAASLPTGAITAEAISSSAPEPQRLAM